MTDLDREAATLRRRVAHEDFAGIERSLNRYVELVEAEKSPAVLAEARDLIEWARRSVRAARARLSQERDRLRGVAQYRDPSEPATHFSIDA